MVEFLTGDPAQLPAAISAFFGGQQQQPEPEAPRLQAPMQQPQMGATPPMAPGMPGAAPQRDPEMDSVARVMETITNAYGRVKSGQPTDRITDILKARSAERPSWSDIGQAISTSFGSITVGDHGKYVGVGEALNNLRANKILEAEKIAKTQIEDEKLDLARQKALVDDVVGLFKHADTMRRQDRQYDLSVEQHRELTRHRLATERIAAANAAGNLDRVKLEELRAAEQIRHNKVMEGVALSQRTPFQKDYEFLTDKLRIPQEDVLRILKPERQERVLSVGESYNTLLEYKSYLDAGQDAPQDLVNRATAAAHILKTKRFVQTPEGTQSYTPGIPEGFPDPGTSNAQAGRATPQQGPPKPTLTMEVPKTTKDRVGVALGMVDEVADLLNEAKTANETITGIHGWVKVQGGGLARQAGLPISPRAERLNRKLELLKALAASSVMQETKLSNEERTRLDKVIGDVSPIMDEIILRETLADIADLLSKSLK